MKRAPRSSRAQATTGSQCRSYVARNVLLHGAPRHPDASALRQGLCEHRLRALHAAGRAGRERARRAVGRHAARSSAACTRSSRPRQPAEPRLDSWAYPSDRLGSIMTRVGVVAVGHRFGVELELGFAEALHEPAVQAPSRTPASRGRSAASGPDREARRSRRRDRSASPRASSCETIGSAPPRSTRVGGIVVRTGRSATAERARRASRGSSPARPARAAPGRPAKNAAPTGPDGAAHRRPRGRATTGVGGTRRRRACPARRARAATPGRARAPACARRPRARRARRRRARSATRWRRQRPDVVGDRVRSRRDAAADGADVEQRARPARDARETTRPGARPMRLTQRPDRNTIDAAVSRSLGMHRRRRRACEVPSTYARHEPDEKGPRRCA